MTDITFIHAVSGQFITVNDVTVKLDYKYKKLKSFELLWISEDNTNEYTFNRKPGLVYWDDDGRHDITFTGTKTEFKRYCQPLLTIFNKNVSKTHDIKAMSLKLKEIDTRINIARNRNDESLLNELLDMRNNLDVIDHTLIEFCPYCGRVKCSNDCLIGNS